MLFDILAALPVYLAGLCWGFVWFIAQINGKNY
jgi:hypothetical protein